MGFNIPEELKKLPKDPGVYLMHNKKDEIIYIGKAKNLHNRVRQYFTDSYAKSSKIQQMVNSVAYFEYIITDSELEALVLENNLIKENRPRYNTMLRDDKTYPYIKVTLGEDYPRILLTRQMKKDRSKYYGPFSSAYAVRDTIDMLQKSCHIRNCSKVLPRDTGTGRPCLNYYIHMCDAPCMGSISSEDYMANVKRVLDFLDGNFEPTINSLQEQMQTASENLDYETAAQYRDLLNSVLHVAQRQKITSADAQDRDVIAMTKDDNDAVIQIFFVREGKLIGREHHFIRVAVDDSRGEILESFIKQFYANTPMLPHELMLQYEIPDQELVQEWLSEKRGKSSVQIVTPKKGQKEKLVELAYKNACIVMEQDRERIKRDQAKSLGAVHEIEKLTGLSGIHRMEAYDISNISGVEAVGSMVVYEDGKPKRHDYRKFRIRTVKGPDDYSSMYEVLTRRFTHDEEKGDLSFNTRPDLIMMDGGKGQVGIALRVLAELGLDIPVCGMVKDDSHRTRGLYFNGKELPIDTHSEGFKLTTRIQDEAHRFAIEYHRSLRSKDQVKSVLDDIPGIGPARRKALIKAFGDIDRIRTAEPDELAAVDGMNTAAAEAVYRFFR
ncbi:MAG: excinuclease ABC subunit UvrC [Lachnospiraceae bacterium]|nr:excinuclease ABC subunit UvrC [Lachnospiraceae bacterium]